MIYNESLRLPRFCLLIKANSSALCSISLTNLKNIKDKPNEITSLTKAELVKYFTKKPYDFSALTLDLSSFSAFSRAIFSELCKIAHAEQITYKELGYRLNSRAFIAMSATLAKNPYPIILPCHRIMRSDSALRRQQNSDFKDFLIKHEKSFALK